MNVPRFAVQRLTLGFNLKSYGLTSVCQNYRRSLVDGAARFQISSNYSMKAEILEMKSLQVITPQQRWSSSLKANQLFPSIIRRIHTSGNNENEVLEKNRRMLPPLMTFPLIVWPDFTKGVRNGFLINHIIKPHLDKDFSMNDFILGAKQAVSVVSNKLAEGKLDELEGLVEPSALAQLKESISNLTVFQQQRLGVAVEDIFVAFPHQIEINIPGKEGSPTQAKYVDGAGKTPQRRHVEITVCLHVDLETQIKEFTRDDDYEYLYNVMICNYRFFKDFTEGNPDPSWKINMANQFILVEHDLQKHKF